MLPFMNLLCTRHGYVLVQMCQIKHKRLILFCLLILLQIRLKTFRLLLNTLYDFDKKMMLQNPCLWRALLTLPIHLYIVKKDLQVSENLGNGLLNMYVKFGDMDSAEKLFDGIDMKTVFSWSSMIEGYMQKGDWESASVFFDQMPEKDVTAWNVMLNEFIAGNDLAAAEVLFRRAPEKDVVSWNCMIAGYAENKNFTRSLELFKEMILADIRPDRITISSLLAVCGFAGAMNLGESVHSIMKKQNIMGEEVEVALMDMYSNCGAPDEAMKSFDDISIKSVWT
ncbi:putative pentatricopeptide repeat-containing protein At3g15930 [Apium graveolens]|uniref:putative pentatricopeptide repeat-containing protein At3g15930 n=1 Tax=Apium graveolens TaxID=4045 RepID=UPI003D79E25B